MAKATTLSNATVNAQADALARLLDNGYLRIYSGTKPTDADTAIGAQALLAELRFGSTSAPGAALGVLTFNPITSDTAADASGTASWFRAFKADGTSVVLDGTVGVTGSTSNIELASTSIVKNIQVAITSFVHSVQKTTSGL